MTSSRRLADVIGTVTLVGAVTLLAGPVPTTLAASAAPTGAATASATRTSSTTFASALPATGRLSASQIDDAVNTVHALAAAQGRDSSQVLSIVLGLCRHPTIRGGDKLSNALVGTPGTDIINGYGAGDRIRGGDGDDVICGGHGEDVIRGGGGDDIIVTGGGAETAATPFADVVLAGPGNDRTFASPGADDLDGGPGSDRFDLMVPYRGTKVSGGPGRDRLWVGTGHHAPDGDVVADVNLGRLDWGSTRVRFDDVNAFAFAVDNRHDFRHEVRFIGSDRGESVSLDGVDHAVVRTGKGNDVIEVNTPRVFDKTSVFSGGDGGDKVMLNARNGAYRYNLNSGKMFVNGDLRGVLYGERFRLTTGIDGQAVNASIQIAGTPGPDKVWAASGNLFVSLKGGKDELRLANLPGRAGGQTVYGGNGDDFLVGSSADETFRAGRGKDIVRGEEGDDRLHGGPGNDRLGGGPGRDAANGDFGKRDFCVAEVEIRCDF